MGTLSGGFAGGTVGYNWQNGNLVLGLEADGAWADVGIGPRVDRLHDPLDGTVRGRIGYAFDQVLPLWHRRPTRGLDNRLSATVLGVSISDSHPFHSGWTVGAGVEVMFAPKWSFKAEYLYRSFEGQTYFEAPFQAASPSARSI
ncbi:outer membrane protein [Bradyrhizobium sp. TZ2]